MRLLAFQIAKYLSALRKKTMADGIFRQAVLMQTDDDSPEIGVYLAADRYYFRVCTQPGDCQEWSISAVEWARMKAALDGLA